MLYLIYFRFYFSIYTNTLKIHISPLKLTDSGEVISDNNSNTFENSNPIQGRLFGFRNHQHLCTTFRALWYEATFHSVKYQLLQDNYNYMSSF